MCKKDELHLTYYALLLYQLMPPHTAFHCVSKSVQINQCTLSTQLHAMFTIRASIKFLPAL